jgi:hypothetical protein
MDAAIIDTSVLVLVVQVLASVMKDWFRILFRYQIDSLFFGSLQTCIST